MDTNFYQTLARQLNMNLALLRAIQQRFKFKSKKELTQTANQVKSIQNEIGQDIDTNELLDFYEAQVGKAKDRMGDVKEKVGEIGQNVADFGKKAVEKGKEVVEKGVEIAKEAVGRIIPGGVNFESRYSPGYRFNAGRNSLVGECAWFAEQITRLNGNTWTIGNTIGQKKNKLAQYVKQGLGFLKGQDRPKAGHSIVFDMGTKWGHVGVVKDVLPDGRLRITESNIRGNKTVTHDRVIDPNDKTIVGFLRTEPTQGFTYSGQTTAPAETDPPIKQNFDNSANGKQELQEEDQPVLPQDVEMQNPNALKVQKETGLSPEQVKQGAINTIEDKNWYESTTQLINDIKNYQQSPEDMAEGIEQKSAGEIGQEKVDELQGKKEQEPQGFLKIFAKGGESDLGTQIFKQFTEGLPARVGQAITPEQQQAVETAKQNKQALFQTALQPIKQYQDPLGIRQALTSNNPYSMVQRSLAPAASVALSNRIVPQSTISNIARGIQTIAPVSRISSPISNISNIARAVTPSVVRSVVRPIQQTINTASNVARAVSSPAVRSVASSMARPAISSAVRGVVPAPVRQTVQRYTAPIRQATQVAKVVAPVAKQVVRQAAPSIYKRVVPQPIQKAVSTAKNVWNKIKSWF